MSKPSAPPRTAHLPARNRSSRPLAAAAILSLGVYAAFLTVFRITSNDLWIHLATGRYVLAHLRVPVLDPYSFSAAGHAYVAHEWLAAVLFQLANAAAGVRGLILFKFAVIAATVALLFQTARRLGGRLSVLLPVLAGVLYLASSRFFVRPHIFSYLLAAWFLYCLFRFREGGRRSAWLLAILPAQVLWVNLHGGWVVGLALLAVFAAGETLAALRARFWPDGDPADLPLRDLALLWGLVPAAVAVSLLNPYGYRALLFPFELTGLQLFMKEIYEWRPPWDPSFNTSTAFLLYLLYIGAFCLSSMSAFRRGGGGRVWVRRIPPALLGVIYGVLAVCWLGRSAGYWRPDVLQAALLVLLGLFLANAAWNVRRADFTQAGVFLLFYALSLRHSRAVVDAALLTAPLLVAAVSRWLDARDSARARAARPGKRKKTGAGGSQAEAAGGQPADPSRPAAVLAGVLLLLGLTLHGTLDRYYLDFEGTVREPGFGIASNMPVRAVDFIVRNGIAGNAFASYSHAALLIDRAWPAVKVGMDSRNDVYGEALYREYRAALSDPAAMAAYLNKYPVDFFLLAHGDCAPAVWTALAGGGEWAPVYFDDLACVLLRREPRYEAVIRDNEYRWLRPTSLLPVAVNAANAPAVLAEAERCVRNDPDAWYGRFHQVQALMALDRWEDVLRACRELERINPREPSVYLVTAAACIHLDRRADAAAAYEQALRLDPNNADAQTGLKRLRRF
jgi:hypothetical protein